MHIIGQENVGEQVSSCIEHAESDPNLSPIISEHMRCDHVWAGWCRLRHLHTSSPHWRLIFTLFSHNAKPRECVGSFIFDLPWSRPLYLCCRLCIQVGFHPAGRSRGYRWQVESMLFGSVSTSWRLARHWLIDLVCACVHMVGR